MGPHGSAARGRNGKGVLENLGGALQIRWALGTPFLRSRRVPRGPRTGEPGAVERGVLALFLTRPDEPVTRYRARRRMKAWAMGTHAWVDVAAEFEPETGFRWRVESEGGSRSLIERSLLRLLRSEEEAHASGLAPRSALTSENYALEPLGRDPDGLVRFRARPRRREAGLVDGTFLVTPDTADIVRVEGRLARSPSFWISSAEASRQYARIVGHRVVVRLDSTASLRLFGKSRIVVTYEYEMIDGDHIPPAAVASLAQARVGDDLEGRGAVVAGHDGGP